MTLNLATPMSYAAVMPLTATIRAGVASVYGVSINGREVIVHLPDGTSQADQDTAQAAVDAHDPVFLATSRTGDLVTVQVSKPRNLDSATEVQLVIVGIAYPQPPPITVKVTPVNLPLPLPTPLTDNIGTVVITSANPIVLGVQGYPCDEVLT